MKDRLIRCSADKARHEIAAAATMLTALGILEGLYDASRPPQAVLHTGKAGKD